MRGKIAKKLKRMAREEAVLNGAPSIMVYNDLKRLYKDRIIKLK